VHGLVNNAGIFKGADFLNISEADWDAVIGVNLKGAFLVGQAVARHMAAQGGGAIVHMSSVNGTLAIPNIASYNASKGGINQLTRAMALALVDHGIRVNAVAPGTIATELARAAVLTSDEARERIMSRTPMRRLGEPDEVAEVVAFLLSDAAIISPAIPAGRRRAHGAELHGLSCRPLGRPVSSRSARSATRRSCWRCCWRRATASRYRSSWASWWPRWPTMPAPARWATGSRAASIRNGCAGAWERPSWRWRCGC
jgi:hypothetical protein